MIEKAAVLTLLAVMAFCVAPGWGAASPAAEDAQGLDRSAGVASADSMFEISIDVRPGLCPNHLRLESSLTLPVAVLGTVDFEVFGIDPATVRRTRDGSNGEVSPVGWAYADVGTPLIGGLCACHKRRGDGLDDLEFSFRISDVVKALDLSGHAGETLPITLRGTLVTGEPFEGTDCTHIISGYWPGDESGDELGLLAPEGDQPGPDGFKLAYFTTVTDRVTVTIYDSVGRKVARLQDMDMPPGIYSAVWDGTDSDSLRVAPGIYFARVSNSLASDTRRLLLP